MKKLHLRNMPDDIHKKIVEEQAKIKIAGEGHISLERVIYRMIRTVDIKKGV